MEFATIMTDENGSEIADSLETTEVTKKETSVNTTKIDAKKRSRWRRYLAEERLEADTYRYLARSRTGAEREILLQLCKAEERHEQHWLKLLGSEALPAPKAPLCPRLLNGLAKSFGSIFVLALMQRAEQRSAYDTDTDVPANMAADEHIHGEVVRGLADHQRSTMAGSFRAAIFGMNDGIVSVYALILGMVGAMVGREAIVAAGIAGLLAGALSMAAGEYISVHSQIELLKASDPNPESLKVISNLDMSENELALVFQARGDSLEIAQEKAAQAFKDLEAGRQKIINHQREHGEVGTGKKAAISSFIFFAGGAFVPLLAFLIPWSTEIAVIVASVLVAVTLLITGSVVGMLSGSSPVQKALRQLLIGILAAAVTYGLGAIVG